MARAAVVVIGDGVIGLSTALRLADAGVDTSLIGVRREGSALGAAAGLLAPSIGSLPPAVQRFFDASLDRYDAFLAPLHDVDPELHLLRGLIEVLDGTPRPRGDGRLLTRREVVDLAPTLHAPHGALLHPRDGAIDNVRLVAALGTAVERSNHVHWTRHDAATRLQLDQPSPRVVLESGLTIDADWIVLAAGAWSPAIAGLPRPLPIRPLKGQMLAVQSSALSHPVMGEGIYIVPRGSELVIGATVEDAGFDLTISNAALDGLLGAASRVVPSVSQAAVTRRWSGLRPATPDMLPIIGIDPSAPRLIYACGHSKNGILLAPATAAAVSSLVGAERWDVDLDAFSPRRFATA